MEPFTILMIIMGAANVGHRAIRWFTQKGKQKDADLAAKKVYDEVTVSKIPSKKYFLYLRGFESDENINVEIHAGGGHRGLGVGIGEWWALEYAMGHYLSKTNPFIALIRSKKKIYGPGGLTFERGANWKEVVRNLAKKAKLIFMVPSLSPGVGIEIKLLKDERLLRKTIFLILPAFDRQWKNGVEALKKKRFNVEDVDFYTPELRRKYALVALRFNNKCALTSSIPFKKTGFGIKKVVDRLVYEIN